MKMYDGPVQGLQQAVLGYIRKHDLLKAGDRVGVAVSGGADSVALLRLLLELRSDLGVVLSVTHFNHKLRGADSENDEEFVRKLADQYRLELFAESGDVHSHAVANRKSLETAARAMRYEFFRKLLTGGKLKRIATGHTLDDQAETVLLRIVRGAGTRGIAAIYPRLNVQQSEVSSQPDLAIVRPLLATRRRDIELYLAGIGQVWREDKSNRDLRHSRNRVRHGILPRLERNLNPSVREALAEAAEIARTEENYWEEKVREVLPSICPEETCVKVKALQHLPLALQRRVVRRCAEGLGLRLEFREVENILELAGAEKPSARSEKLANDWCVERHKDELRFVREDATEPRDYEYRLPVPGSVAVRETRSSFEAAFVSGRIDDGYNPEQSIARDTLGAGLCIRNWRAGDRYWPAHTKAPKKIKELLTDRHVEGIERKLWPVVASGSEVVWMRGFPSPANRRPRSEAEAVVIREVPLNSTNP